MNRRTPLILLLALLVATPAVAGIGEENGEIGFDFGFTEFDSNVTDDSGVVVNFRGGYHFTELFQLEGQVGCSVAEEFGVDVSLCYLFANGVFNFHPANENIVPYFLVGIGQVNLEFENVPLIGTVDDDDIAYQLAGGSRFFFGASKRVAFRAELSVLSEDTFNTSSTHVNFVGGFTWVLGQGQ